MLFSTEELIHECPLFIFICIVVISFYMCDIILH